MAMLRVHCDDLWSTVARLTKGNFPRVAAVAYVSSDKKVAFTRGDVLVTDASNENISRGQTSASVLRAAFERGARVYSIAGLHAKVICLGRYCVVGSANLSASSVGNLIEVGIITDHPGALADARSLIARLQSVAQRVDDPFLRRIERIRVIRQKVVSPKPRILKPSGGGTTWIVGVQALDEDRFPGEAAFARRGEVKARQSLDATSDGTSWLRFTGNSGFRHLAKAGDRVIQIWRPTATSRPGRVYYPTPILLRQNEPTCTRFYVPDFPDDEERSLSWRDFQRIWQMAGAKRAVPARTARRVDPDVAERLIALWRPG